PSRQADSLLPARSAGRPQALSPAVGRRSSVLVMPRRVRSDPASRRAFQGHGTRPKGWVDGTLGGGGMGRSAGQRPLRAPKNAEGEGHPFTRPVVQKAVSKVASEIMKQGVVPWPHIMERLAELDWKMSSPPWEAVFDVENG